MTEPTWQRFETGGKKIAPYLAARCMRLLNGEIPIPKDTPRNGNAATTKGERMSQSTTTRVQVTVEVIDPQPWSPDTAAGQIYKRASDAAMSAVRAAIATNLRCQVVGEPRVSLVMTEDKS